MTIRLAGPADEEQVLDLELRHTVFEFGKHAATNVQCSSTTTCTATAPAGKEGAVEVIAETSKKLKSAANPPDDQFTYE